MLSQFQASYQRVEASLQKLTESIAAYNPLVTAAEELVAADDAVNADINQLVQHQRNHQRILTLRQTSAALDESLKSTLRLLADTRREIQAIPAAAAPDSSSSRREEVQVDDLLAYAKFIARTTVPPTFRKPIPDDLFPKKKPRAQTQTQALDNNHNGMVTPQPDSSAAEDSTTTTTNPIYYNHLSPTGLEDGLAVQTLPPQEKAFITSSTQANLPFEPWPSHAVIQRGSLAAIQRLAESGVDPGSVLSREERAEEERRRREEEEREEVEREVRERRKREAWGGGTGTGRREVGRPFDPDEL